MLFLGIGLVIVEEARESERTRLEATDQVEALALNDLGQFCDQEVAHRLNGIVRLSRWLGQIDLADNKFLAHHWYVLSEPARQGKILYIFGVAEGDLHLLVGHHDALRHCHRDEHFFRLLLHQVDDRGHIVHDELLKACFWNRDNDDVSEV